MNRHELAGVIYDYAVAHPEGFEKLQACEDLGVRPDEFQKAVQVLRDICADDEITLICDPQSKWEGWRYRLTGRFDEARGWITNRIKDLERRLLTVEHLAASLVKATDGRSLIGRKARHIHLSVKHLREQLELMNETGGGVS